MAGDDRKTKTEPTPKKDAAAKDKSTTDKSKADGGEPAADPSSGYSRGEGQKPVSKAYRDNWNAIFGKKKKR